MGLSLDKGQSLSLKKEDGANLSKVTVGLGWDPAGSTNKGGGGFFGKLFGGGGSSGGDIDLDASILTYGANKKHIETIFYNNLKSRDGSIKHAGDNLTGDGDGDDEQIILNLSNVGPNVHYLAVAITSYSGQNFNQVENVFCRLLDDSSGGKEILRYNLRESGDNTAQVMAVLSRNADGWTFKAVGVPARAKTPAQLVDISAGLL